MINAGLEQLFPAVATVLVVATEEKKWIFPVFQHHVAREFNIGWQHLIFNFIIYTVAVLYNLAYMPCCRAIALLAPSKQ